MLSTTKAYKVLRDMRRKELAMAVAFVMVLSSITGAAVLGSIPGGDAVPLYVPHAPIRIDSNAEFASMALAEGWSGSGAEADPWVIEGYDIDGTGYGYCIYIGNVTGHFQIIGCRMHNADGDLEWPLNHEHGVLLYYAQNGMILSSLLENNSAAGAYLFGSSLCLVSGNTAIGNNANGLNTRVSHNNVFSNNVLTHNQNGIMVSDSSNESYYNNTITGNWNHGVYVWYLADCVFTNNNISANEDDGFNIGHANGISIINNTISHNNYDGIYISSSDGATINNNSIGFSGDYNNGLMVVYTSGVSAADNIFSDDGIYIYGEYLEHWNTHDIAASNLINGRPILYMKNANGATITDGYGQVIFGNCQDITVENASFERCDSAIQFGFSEDCLVRGNAVTSTYEGMRLQHCSLINVSSNRFDDMNPGLAIFLKYSNLCSIFNNELNNVFNGAGILLKNSDHNIIAGNWILDSSSGINLDYGSYPSNFNTVHHNTLVNVTNDAVDGQSTNAWDDGYPSGGNFWSDYTGIDVMSGPDQDVPGPDGIGDTPHIIDADTMDRYPLISGAGGAPPHTYWFADLGMFSPRIRLSQDGTVPNGGVTRHWVLDTPQEVNGDVSTYPGSPFQGMSDWVGSQGQTAADNYSMVQSSPLQTSPTNGEEVVFTMELDANVASAPRVYVNSGMQRGTVPHGYIWAGSVAHNSAVTDQEVLPSGSPPTTFFEALEMPSPVLTNGPAWHWDGVSGPVDVAGDTNGQIVAWGLLESANLLDNDGPWVEVSTTEMGGQIFHAPQYHKYYCVVPYWKGMVRSLVYSQPFTPILAAVALPESQSVFIGENASFDGSHSSGDIVSYTWDFGDETQGSGITAKHKYTFVCNYEVTLTVSDAFGNSASDTCIVDINAITDPYPIFGYVKDPSIGAALPGCTVEVTYMDPVLSDWNTLVTTSSGTGQYIVDLNNYFFGGKVYCNVTANPNGGALGANSTTIDLVGSPYGMQVDILCDTLPECDISIAPEDIDIAFQGECPCQWDTLTINAEVRWIAPPEDPVQGPLVQLVKTGPATAIAGQLITYTISYTNIGTEACHNLWVTEYYPPEVSFLTSIPLPIIIPNCWYIGTVLPGNSGSITIQVQVNAGASGLLINTALAEYTDQNGTDMPPAVSYASTSLEPSMFGAQTTGTLDAVHAECTVSFYLDTISPANLINREYGVQVPYDGSANVSFSWLCNITGNHSVIVDVTDVVPDDMEMANNTASKALSVSQPTGRLKVKAASDEQHYELGEDDHADIIVKVTYIGALVSGATVLCNVTDPDSAVTAVPLTEAYPGIYTGMYQFTNSSVVGAYSISAVASKAGYLDGENDDSKDKFFLDSSAALSPAVSSASLSGEVIPLGTDVVVLADIANPEGVSTLYASLTGHGRWGTFTAPLHDDGEHADGQAGDGLFGAVFDTADMQGTYALDISLNGLTTDKMDATVISPDGMVAMDKFTGLEASSGSVEIPSAVTNCTIDLNTIVDIEGINFLFVEHRSTSGGKDLEFIPSSNALTAMTFARIKATYAEEDVPANVSEDLLKIYVYDIYTESLEPLEPSGVDTFSDLIWGETEHFSEFRIMARPPACTLQLAPGWNLISFPVTLLDGSVPALLSPINGLWDSAKYYDKNDAMDPWKSYRPGGTANDLLYVDHTMSLWVHVTAPADLPVYGTPRDSTQIVLTSGWNFVGYPTLTTGVTVGDALWGTGAVAVEFVDPASPTLLRSASPTDLLSPGQGMWVRVPADTVWTVDW